MSTASFSGVGSGGAVDASPPRKHTNTWKFWFGENRAKSLKIQAKSMKIWAKYLKPFAMSVQKWRPTWFDFKKMARPNVGRITWRPFC